MELEEFIKNTLISIRNGVHGANEELAKTEGKKLGEDATAVFVLGLHSGDKKEEYIAFDVAVTVSSETKKGGGGVIKVLGLSVGGEMDNIGAQEHVSRIKFHILPFKTIG
ncbi:MAG: hypothetical protein Q8Q89_00880 [bacterium]|nr:hypothetical protein [bacterium]